MENLLHWKAETQENIVSDVLIPTSYLEVDWKLEYKQSATVVAEKFNVRFKLY